MTTPKSSKPSDAVITPDIAFRALARVVNPHHRREIAKEFEELEPHLHEVAALTISTSIGHFASFCEDVSEEHIRALRIELETTTLLLYAALTNGYRVLLDTGWSPESAAESAA